MQHTCACHVHAQHVHEHDMHMSMYMHMYMSHVHVHVPCTCTCACTCMACVHAHGHGHAHVSCICASCNIDMHLYMSMCMLHVVCACTCVRSCHCRRCAPAELREQATSFHKTSRTVRVVSRSKHRRLQSLSCIVFWVMVAAAAAPLIVLYWDEILAFFGSALPPHEASSGEAGSGEAQGGVGLNSSHRSNSTL